MARWLSRWTLPCARPDPQGPGGPCRDTLTWVQGRLDACLETLRRRGLTLPPAVVVAESWFSDSKLMRHVRRQHQGTLLVEGKKSYVFALADGRQVNGSALVNRADWPWCDHPWEVGVRYTRLRATSPTYGAVTLVIMDEPGQDRFYLNVARKL